jgi:hypothetical protein
VLRVEALPAGEGDSLWIEWSAADGVHRMLVDGGRAAATVTARLAAQPVDQRRFDVVVCTHIDLDHIGGLLPVLAAPPDGFAAADLWFNGRKHAVPPPPPDGLGYPQANDLTDDLVRTGQPWNAAFAERAVVVPDTGALPEVRLPGLTVTLLAPTRPALDKLGADWPKVVAAARPGRPADVLGGRDEYADWPLAKLADLPFVAKDSVANASSIALLLHHDDGSRVLLCADAPSAALVAGLDRLRQDREPMRVDLCKLPHHGSAANVSPALLDALTCAHWLVSTSGAYHRHPDRMALARLLVRRGSPTLWFNYRSGTTEEFGRSNVTGRWGNRAEYPAPGTQGVCVEVVDGQVRRG